MVSKALLRLAIELKAPVKNRTSRATKSSDNRPVRKTYEDANENTFNSWVHMAQDAVTWRRHNAGGPDC